MRIFTRLSILVFALFLALAAAIAVVLGGCQALSRSYFSNLVPAGRTAAGRRSSASPTCNPSVSSN